MNAIIHPLTEPSVPVYPLFDPFFVSYDKGSDSYESLAHVSQRVLSLRSHREKQLAIACSSLHRTLSPSEKTYLGRFLEMVEISGGQVEDGIFVTSPGVMLLARTQPLTSDVPVSPLWQATFLICGISVETSLELVAHKEARVARLTSSKTKASSNLTFRVQGSDVLPQKRLIEQTLALRSEFEAKWNPRMRWADGNELFNMVRLAFSSSVL